MLELDVKTKNKGIDKCSHTTILGKCYPLRYQEDALPAKFEVCEHSIEEETQDSDDEVQSTCYSEEGYDSTTDEDAQ